MWIKRLLGALGALGVLVAVGSAFGEDTRQLVTMPAPAQAALRQEMLGNLLAINEVTTLLAEGKLAEAGQLAEEKLGIASMGKHRTQPLEARPGAHMPAAMHEIGMAGHRAASDFARAAAAGDREQALARLPGLTAGCVACHHAYRLH